MEDTKLFLIEYYDDYMDEQCRKLVRAHDSKQAIDAFWKFIRSTDLGVRTIGYEGMHMLSEDDVIEESD